MTSKDCPLQKYRLITRKIIFIVPPVPACPKSEVGEYSPVALPMRWKEGISK